MYMYIYTHYVTSTAATGVLKTGLDDVKRGTARAPASRRADVASTAQRAPAVNPAALALDHLVVESISQAKSLLLALPVETDIQILTLGHLGEKTSGIRVDPPAEGKGRVDQGAFGISPSLSDADIDGCRHAEACLDARADLELQIGQRRRRVRFPEGTEANTDVDDPVDVEARPEYRPGSRARVTGLIRPTISATVAGHAGFDQGHSIWPNLKTRVEVHGTWRIGLVLAVGVHGGNTRLASAYIDHRVQIIWWGLVVVGVAIIHVQMYVVVDVCIEFRKILHGPDLLSCTDLCPLEDVQTGSNVQDFHVLVAESLLSSKVGISFENNRPRRSTFAACDESICADDFGCKGRIDLQTHIHTHSHSHTQLCELQTKRAHACAIRLT